MPLDVELPAWEGDPLMPQRHLKFATSALVLFLMAPAVFAEDKPAASDAKPKVANRLARETSPYLLLHAHNPVDWYPWGPEAFEKAKKENKLIFLSIGYSSCYWCHVMERQSFANADIAKLMNDWFVCVKVDREERPDVDNIYMTALHVQGSRGGWPLSMFLLPDGKPIGGGTYWPPEDREEDGRKYYGFKSILRLIHDDWRKKPDDLKEHAQKVAAAVSVQLAGSGRKLPAFKLTPSLVSDAVTAVKSTFDPVHGGFGSKERDFRGPKFPQPVLSSLLLAAHLRDKDETTLKIITHTLDRMARGGMYDHLGGGFHRYSTDREWKIPHFEKMLYDNAQLVSLYSHAYALTRDPAHRRVIEETLAFVSRELTSPEGGFYSALDAETDAEEGKYYVWTAAEIDKLLPPQEAGLFKVVYGITSGPNFEEKFNVLLVARPWKELAADLRINEEQLHARLAVIRSKVLAERARRERPLLDTKILTGWNGLMIAGYADAARALDNPAYAQTGEKAADFLLKNLRGPDGRLLRTYSKNSEGKTLAKLNAYLEDYASLVHGLLTLHEVTGKKRWLDEAARLTNEMVERYEDKEAGGFFFTSHDHEKFFARAKDQYDGATPSGNSLAALNLVRLAARTGDERYRQLAEKTFTAFGETLTSSPETATMMVQALALYLGDDKKKAEDNPFNPAGAKPKQADPVKITAQIKSQKVDAKGHLAVTVAVTLDIEKGFHAYANPAGDDSLLPTTVSVSGDPKPEDVKVTYPAGKERKDDVLDQTIRVYEGKVTIDVSFHRPTRNTDPLEVTVKYQVCNEMQCLPPKTVKVKVEEKSEEKKQP
jgi:hypothetical protein